MPRSLLFPALFSAVFLCGSLSGSGQVAIPAAYPASGTVNYIRTWTATAPDPTASHLITRPLTDVKQSTTYSDGFGRPVQTVAKQASPAGNDLVEASIYDPTTGNEIYHYLPFSMTTATTGDFVNDGNYKLDRFHEQVAFYNSYLVNQAGETSSSSSVPNWAYGQTTYEASPMDRGLVMLAPGVNWVGASGSRSSQQGYAVNTATDNVIMWGATTYKSTTNLFTPSPTLPTYQGVYPANELYKTISTDEQGHQEIQFKDQYGQLILKKVQNSAAADNGSGSAHAGWFCTYYVYDDYGNLRFVLTPNVVQLIDGNWSGITQSYMDELCFYFEYDNQNRPVIKKSPGTSSGINGEVWTVYDQRDRMVLSQDGYQRSAKKWKYFQYDALDRTIATGFITDPSSNLTDYTNLNAHANNAASSITYPNVASYTSELLTQSFYDDYNWMSATNSSTLPATMTGGSSGYGNSNFVAASTTTAPYPLANNQQSKQTHGKLIGSRAEVMGSNATKFIYNVSFFDSKGRIIQGQSINYSGGVDISTNQYDWSGTLLVNVVSNTIVSASNPQTHTIATVMSYDPVGRLLTMRKNISSTVGGSLVTASSLVETNQYDELSRMKKKILGNNLESMTYDYNVRGWLLGANRDYARTALSTSNYFGFDIGYDQSAIVPSGGSSIGSYANLRYNGDIGGTLWKSKGDGVIRKYDYTYNSAQRLATAPYTESSTINTWSSSPVNFSVGNLGYDANGNLGSMQQYGYQVGGSQMIDNLTYNYVLGKNTTTGANYTNRLQNVTDNSNTPTSTLGDLHYPASPAKTVSSVDYNYNGNGVITSDYNRGVSSIGYFYEMDLPSVVTIPGKGTIEYAYDANGVKLQKKVTQTGVNYLYNGANYSTNIVTTTNYLDGFVYKTVYYDAVGLAPLNVNNTDVLQFTGQEDGRIRFIPGSPGSFVFDYFLRDHLSSVRMVLTDEQPTDIYPAATVETVSQSANGVVSTPQAFESQYYYINSANVIPTSTLPWWSAVTGSSTLVNNNNNNAPLNNDPYSNTTATSASVYKLNGSTGDKTGLGITLKVMAGDVVNIYGKSVWHNTNTAVTYQPITSALVNFFTAIATSTPVTVLEGGSVTAATLNGASATTAPLTTMLNGTPNQTSNTTYAPKAAINWILFDDQFRPVAGSMGTSLVSSTSDQIYGHTTIPSNITMARSGFLYVYCSNESNVDVYFDNLQVTLKHGPIAEETHYYPFGLAMAGISDRAWGKTPNYYHFQGNEMQTGEWKDGTGLEEYDFSARYYDQQLGVWHAQDPANQFASPYLAMNNSWVNSADPNGKFIWFIPLIIGAVAGGFEGYQIGHAHGASGWSMAGYIFGGAAIGALSGYAGGEIAAAGGAFSNTAAIIVGSSISSMGMFALSGGETDVSISFGVGSFDLTSGSLGYLGKKGNGFWDNFGYGLGAIANMQDVLAGLHPGTVKAEFEKEPEEGQPGGAKGKDLIGHTEIVTNDGHPLIDFGPHERGGAEFTKFTDARNNWTAYSTDGEQVEVANEPTNLWKGATPVNGVNLDRLQSISNRLNVNPGKYNFLLRSCSSVASRALMMSGKFLIGGIYPNLLRLSVILNDAGVRPSIFSYLLENN
jgi:RHS repeat-associated protein